MRGIGCISTAVILWIRYSEENAMLRSWDSLYPLIYTSLMHTSLMHTFPCVLLAAIIYSFLLLVEIGEN